MKTLKLILCLQVCLFAFAIVHAQTSHFNLAEYQQFLNQHQNMTTAQLLAMHPAGEFKKTADLAWESVLYLDSIEIKYSLTDYEKTLLRKHGFVVTERLRKDSFGWQFLDVWRKDLPVFVSSDAILHVFHKAYDRILMQVEQGILLNRVTTLLTTMHGKLPELAAQYSANVEMERMLRDVDVYLSVPLKLLGQ
jgi:hypothetical protein